MLIETYIPLTKENILNHISEFEIFSRYIRSLEAEDQFFCSELRKDKIPSCRIHRVKGKLIYKDFGEVGMYDCFDYVKRIYNTDYSGALSIINQDFGLNLGGKKPVISGQQSYKGNLPSTIYGEINKTYTLIQVRYRDWNATTDKAFWKPYGITVKLLNSYNVSPIDRLWINQTLYLLREDEQAYEYYFRDTKRKIYRPTGNKLYKWRCNSPDIIEGWKQLPDSGDIVVITKSLKDIMVYKTVGIPAIAAASETTYLQKEVVEGLKGRFKVIVSNTDMDSTGIAAAKHYRDLYNIKSFMLDPIKHGAKDISDYRKKYGEKALQTLIEYAKIKL